MQMKTTETTPSKDLDGEDKAEEKQPQDEKTTETELKVEDSLDESNSSKLDTHRENVDSELIPEWAKKSDVQNMKQEDDDDLFFS